MPGNEKKKKKTKPRSTPEIDVGFLCFGGHQKTYVHMPLRTSVLCNSFQNWLAGGEKGKKNSWQDVAVTT
jgi:hypothetical protein